MKKLISLMLALIMVFSLATVASAATNASGTDVRSTATSIKFDKKYTLTNGTKYPAETLTFDVTPAEGNPTGDRITVGTNNTVAITGEETEITINVPSYSNTGDYKFTVTEQEGNTQGVVYSKASFDVHVQVYWNDDHSALETNVIIETKDADGEKIDSISNEYKMGKLTVTKEVSGNNASKAQEFDIDVTFTATKEVKSDITYTVAGGAEQTITAAAMSDKTETVTVSLKHGASAVFTNIPDGVTYTVAEQDKHAETDANGSDPSKGYKVDYEGETGTISATADAEATVTNTKEITVATGIITDSAPYIILIAVCAVAAVAFVLKRRNAVEF